MTAGKRHITCLYASIFGDLPAAVDISLVTRLVILPLFCSFYGMRVCSIIDV